jgi:hypothetical protein
MVLAVVRTRAELVLRPRIVRLQRRVARSHDLAGAPELGMIDIDPIVDDRNDDTFSARDLVCAFDIHVRVDDDATDSGPLQVPLLRGDVLRCPAADQLGVAELDVVSPQQVGRDVEHALPGALGRSDEVRIRRVAHLLLHRQPRLAQHCDAVLRIGCVDELDEQVLGVENGLFRGPVDQYAAREPYVRGRAEHALTLFERPRAVSDRHPVHFDSGIGKGGDERSVGELGCDGRGHWPGRALHGALTARAYRDQIVALFEIETRLVLGSIVHAGHEKPP